MSQAVQELWFRHLDALIADFRKLLYGIFVLTALTYLAIIENTTAHKLIADNSWPIIALSAFGNAGWGFLAWRVAVRITSISEMIETRFSDVATDETLAARFKLGSLYRGGGTGLILINWLIFAAVVALLPPP